MKMSEIELLEQEIGQREAYVNRLKNDPHLSSYDKKIIPQQEQFIKTLKLRLKALKKGKEISEARPAVTYSAEEEERGRKAKENPTFPTMRKTQGKYKRHDKVYVSPISIAEGCNVTLR